MDNSCSFPSSVVSSHGKHQSLKNTLYGDEGVNKQAIVWLLLAPDGPSCGCDLGACADQLPLLFTRIPVKERAVLLRRSVELSSTFAPMDTGPHGFILLKSKIENVYN